MSFVDALVARLHLDHGQSYGAQQHHRDQVVVERRQNVPTRGVRHSAQGEKEASQFIRRNHGKNEEKKKQQHPIIEIEN